MGGIGIEEAKLIAIEINETKFAPDVFNMAEILHDIEASFGDSLNSIIPFSDNELSNMRLIYEGGKEAMIPQIVDGKMTRSDVDLEWSGMPECENEDIMPVRKIVVNFKSYDDVKAFSELINQTIHDKTKYVWFPFKEPIKDINKAYVDGKNESGE
jgi:hypothetical protein